MSWSHSFCCLKLNYKKLWKKDPKKVNFRPRIVENHGRLLTCVRTTQYEALLLKQDARKNNRICCWGGAHSLSLIQNCIKAVFLRLTCVQICRSLSCGQPVYSAPWNVLLLSELVLDVSCRIGGVTGGFLAIICTWLGVWSCVIDEMIWLGVGLRRPWSATAAAWNHT